jgi:hypothetical protein
MTVLKRLYYKKLLYDIKEFQDFEEIPNDSNSSIEAFDLEMQLCDEMEIEISDIEELEGL